MTPPVLSQAPFTRYARLFSDVLPALRELPPWQRWIYVEAVHARDRSDRPISRAELGRACGVSPRNISIALDAAAKLELLKIERVKDEKGGDLGLRLSFPWGGSRVTTPGGSQVTTTGGSQVTTPGGSPVTTPRSALLFVPDPSQIDPRSPTPTPVPDASRARAHEQESQEGGGDGASRCWDRSWSIESIRDVLELFPRTPARGGLVPKWLQKIVHRGEPTLRELRAYLRHTSKDPEILGWKFPLAAACDPERWDRWLANHRAAKLAAERAAKLEAAGPELAAARLDARLDAVRRTKRTGTNDAAGQSASKKNDALSRNASEAAKVIETIAKASDRTSRTPVRRLSASRSA